MKLTRVSTYSANILLLIKRLNSNKNNFDVRKIEAGHLYYIISSLAMMVWVNLYAWYTSGTSIFLEGGSIKLDMQLIYTVTYCAGICLSVFLINSKNFRFLSFSGTLAALAGLIMFHISDINPVQGSGVFLMGAGSGFLGVGVAFVYVFVLENTEKIVTIMAIMLSIPLFSLISDISRSVVPEQLYFFISAVILSVILYCTYRYNTEDTPDTLSKDRLPVPALGSYWLLAYIFLIYFTGSIASIIVQYKAAEIEGIFLLRHIGAFIGIGIAWLMLLVFTKGIWHLIYIFLFCITVGFVLVLMSKCGIEGSFGPGVVFFGMTTVGEIAEWYLCGIIGKKYKSMNFVRACLLTSAISAVIGDTFGRLLIARSTVQLYLLGSIISLISISLFFLLTPVLYSFLYRAEWMSDIIASPAVQEAPDTCEAEMEGCCSKEIELELGTIPTTGDHRIKRLTPRETEIFQLLLEGQTLRQISAILKIKYYTVNDHYKRVYEKLEVCSRAELFIKYGDRV